jgi:hypothetical protein
MSGKHRIVFSAIAILAFSTAAFAQNAAPKGTTPPRLLFSVATTAWPDGGEVPMKNAFQGENKSPAFEFRWTLGPNPGSAPEALQSYAVIFHDVENSTNKQRPIL